MTDKRKSICEFNHISIDLTEDQIKESHPIINLD